MMKFILEIRSKCFVCGEKLKDMELTWNDQDGCYVFEDYEQTYLGLCHNCWGSHIKSWGCPMKSIEGKPRLVRIMEYPIFEEKPNRVKILEDAPVGETVVNEQLNSADEKNKELLKIIEKLVLDAFDLTRENARLKH